MQGFKLITQFDFQTTPSPFEDEEDQIYDEPPDGEEDGRSKCQQSVLISIHHSCDIL